MASTIWGTNAIVPTKPAPGLPPFASSQRASATVVAERRMTIQLL
jgi:hypothetical protein